MNQSNKILHERLVDAAIYAANHGRVNKATAIVEGLVESAIRKKVTLWLQKFTAITLDPSDPSKFKYSRQAKLHWCETKARDNPFWDIKLKNSVASTVFTAHPTTATKSTNDCIIAKRHIKIAFERFLDNPTLDRKINLTTMITQYQSGCGETDGNISAKFVAGGLPSLGKRR